LTLNLGLRWDKETIHRPLALPRLNFTYRKRMSHRFSVNANYTLASAYGYDAGHHPALWSEFGVRFSF
jgi:hypothetical protein